RIERINVAAECCKQPFLCAVGPVRYAAHRRACAGIPGPLQLAGATIKRDHAETRGGRRIEHTVDDNRLSLETRDGTITRIELPRDLESCDIRPTDLSQGRKACALRIAAVD